MPNKNQREMLRRACCRRNKVDDQNEVSECNGGNNGFFYWAVTVLPPPQPDLTKGTDSLSNSNPRIGDMLTAALIITNQSCSGGSSNAGPFHVGFYWSTNSSFTGVSPFLEAPLNGCGSNATVTLTQNFFVTSQNTIGAHYLGYKIDDQDEVAECNEANNGIFYWLVVVTNAPPPTIQNVTGTNGMLSFTWSAVSGLTYQVQYKTNLNQTNWLNMGGTMTASNNSMSAFDLIGTNKQRFYRAVSSQ